MKTEPYIHTPLHESLKKIIPPPFRRRGLRVAATLLLRAVLNLAGLAMLLPVLVLVLDPASLTGSGPVARAYALSGISTPQGFALAVCGGVVAVITLKCLVNLALARAERRYIYDLYRTLSRRLYIAYHDRGLAFVKRSHSAVLARNVNVVCLAFAAGVLKPAASIAAEAMLFVLLFTALALYAPLAAVLAVAVFLPGTWLYYGVVRNRIDRYGELENRAQREKSRLVAETFRGYADIEINAAFPQMLRSFDRAMDEVVRTRLREAAIGMLPQALTEIGLAVGMALLVAFGVGGGGNMQLLFGVFAVAALRLMPSVRGMLAAWTTIRYNRYTIDILCEAQTAEPPAAESDGRDDTAARGGRQPRSGESRPQTVGASLPQTAGASRPQTACAAGPQTPPQVGTVRTEAYQSVPSPEPEGPKPAPEYGTGRNGCGTGGNETGTGHKCGSDRDKCGKNMVADGSANRATSTAPSVRPVQPAPQTAAAPKSSPEPGTDPYRCEAGRTETEAGRNGCDNSAASAGIGGRSAPADVSAPPMQPGPQTAPQPVLQPPLQSVPATGKAAPTTGKPIPASENFATATQNSNGEMGNSVREMENSGPETPLPAAGKLPFAREIAVRDLAFRFEDDDRELFRGLTLTIRKGERIGIRGASGAGKTTLFNLLLGLYEPTAGVIAIDGVPLTPANRRAWQNRIGYVSQNLFLCDGTFAENVALGTPPEEIDRTRAAEALEAARMGDFIASLPQGMDTPVGECGCRLSGGQRQRIGIARALYRRSDVLFFDEATSALDSRTEEEINRSIAAIAARQPGMTLVVIAHRESSLDFCDRIITLGE